jgi:hypothetical protein
LCGHIVGEWLSSLGCKAVEAVARSRSLTAIALITQAIAVRRLPFQFIEQPCPDIVEVPRDVR